MGHGRTGQNRRAWRVLLCLFWLFSLPVCADKQGSDTGDGGGSDADSGSGADGGTPPGSSSCGNSFIDDGEGCDDGNLVAGDGCDDDCQPESGFNCVTPGEACEECGNSVVESSEQCDDGNDDSGDGCDSSCQIETGGWVCPLPGAACELCGDGIVSTNERCDEGLYADGVGCSDDCRTLDLNYSCPEPGEACVECGDGVVEGNEACDDGNTESGDGCVYSCQAIEAGWSCPAEGGSCTLCGDGLIRGEEACDDGNFRNGDGCSAECQLEPGASCFEAGVTCAVCGNGVIEVSHVDDQGTPDAADDILTVEECDDGNLEDDDGCDSSCSQDPDFDCPVPGFGCGQCGNGVTEPIEACDDGVDASSGEPVGGDGCSADCLSIEDNYNCTTDGTACFVCGDGILDDTEVCDDGVDDLYGVPVGGDGCSRDCQKVEPGWECQHDVDGFFVGCSNCGNGLLEGDEACDDGNTDGDDGCADDCGLVEDDYNCFYPGFPCVQCGNGEVELGEECDEGHLLTAANATEGCDDQCRVVAPWVCPRANFPCELCGDGTQNEMEQCDDGNTANDDGCTADCLVEEGYVCSDTECIAAACGDGTPAGREACDDGNLTSGDGCSFVCGVEAGWVCPGGRNCHRIVCGDTVVEGSETCDDGNDDDSDGCDSNCTIEIGFECPVPGDACVETECGDSEVAGAEQCDDGNAAPLDGCDADCQLEEGYHCPDPGEECEETSCGDELVQGLEECDDGVDDLSGEPVDGDGCDATCHVEALYQCEGEPSVCEPAFSFVAVLRFNITNVNPAGLVYDPERRSFAGHKSQDSQDPIELCLDGTVLNPNDGECSDGNGCIIAPDGSTSDLAPPCTDGAPDTCYESPIRPVTQGTLVGAAYDPFADRLVFLTSLGSRVTLTHVPSHFDELSDDVTNYQVELSGLTTPKGLTIGEDGNLYIVDDEGTPAVVVYPRRRDTSLELIVPDCATVPEDNCTGFEASPDLAAEWDVPSVDPLDAIFTVPGENWVGIFNQPTGATEYEGTDAEGNTINSSEYFTFYDPALTAIPPLVGRSSLPGELFQLGDIGTSYSQEAQAAETAADGGSFVVCTATASEYCQLFARGCSEDADCEVVPGTVCATGATIPYCHAPGDARDDRFFVEVDATGNNLDVLANDSLSESACLDPVMRILSVDTTGMSGSLVDFAEGDTFLTYDAPGGGECGLVDSFEYTADLGGGVTDTASVRVVIECVCGDGEAQSNEQCDEGDDNGEYPARCSDECMFNVHCGDTHIDPGEECDDGNALSGDGCSALCTLESVCGDGIVEGVEACDDGNNDSGDGCNGNCTEPECGDGSLDYDNDEQCDDGNVANGDGCSQLCTIETECGNGAIEGTEECDDGNILPGDGCSAACTVEGQCGNGVIDEDTGEECDTAFTGSQCADQAECSNRCLCGNYCGDGRIGDLEECDDGQNGVTGDGCRDDCTDEVCGDGIQDPDEECDDGNLDPADGCTNSCEAFTVCGNGALEEGEECDDGNNRSGDGCSSTCANEVTVCGDGAVDFDEQCDDGNTDPGDGCDENCLSEGAVCGDGTREEGEECDDGNRVSGDGCDEQCRWELF